jgi:hypothetical protein
MISFSTFQKAKTTMEAVNASQSLCPLVKALETAPSSPDFLNAFGCYDLSFVPTHDQLYDFQTQTQFVFSKQYLSFGVGLASYYLSESYSDALLQNIDMFFSDSFFQQDNKVLRSIFVDELARKTKETTTINYGLLQKVLDVKVLLRQSIGKATYIDMTRNCSRVPYDEETDAFVKSFYNKIKDQKETNQALYGEKALLQVDFSEEETDQIQLVAHAYFNGYERLPALRQLRIYIQKKQNEPVKTFILTTACLCYVQNVYKEDNKEFWSPFAKWIKANPVSVRNQAYRTEFELYALQQDLNTSNQYVMAFRANSIVANRPVSLEKICRFFRITWKNNGMLRSEEGETSDLLRDSFHSLSSFALPSETERAYLQNEKQVVEFLAPLYEYFIKKGLAFLHVEVDDNQPFNGLHVVQAINSEWEKEKNIRNIERSYRKKHTYHRPYVELQDDDIYLNIGAEELDTSVSSAVLRIVDEQKTILFEDKLDILDSESQSKVYPFEMDWLGKSLLLVAEGEREIYTSHIPDSLVFSVVDQKKILIGLRKTFASELYVVAKDDTSFVADSYTQMESLKRLQMYVFHVSVSDDELLIVNNRLFGTSLEENTIKRHTYLDKTSLVSGAHFELQNGQNYEIRKSLPEVSLVTLETNPSLSINGKMVQTIILRTLPLCDGSGRLFFRLKVCVESPQLNGQCILLGVQGGEDGSKQMGHYGFVLLKDFFYAFNKPYYGHTQKTYCLEKLSFQNKDVLFGMKNYTFPKDYESLRFALFNPKPFGTIVITPPVFSWEVTGNGKDELLEEPNKRFWFSALMGKELCVQVPEDFHGSLVCGFYDDDGKFLARLNPISFTRWSLRNLPEMTAEEYAQKDKRFVAFNLVAVKDYDEKIPLGKVYFREELVCEVARDYSQTQIRVAGLSGWAVHCHFYGNPQKRYTYGFVQNGKTIGGKQVLHVDEKITDCYLRLPYDELQPGLYSLQVETRKDNSFFSPATEYIVNTVDFFKDKELPASQYVQPVQMRHDTRSGYPHGQAGTTIRISTAFCFEDKKHPVAMERAVRGFFIEISEKEIEKGFTYPARCYFITRDNVRHDMRRNPFSVTIQSLSQRTGAVEMTILHQDDSSEPFVNAKGFVDPINDTVGNKRFSRMRGMVIQ